MKRNYPKTRKPVSQPSRCQAIADQLGVDECAMLRELRSRMTRESVAEHLGVSMRALYKRLKHHGLVKARATS